MFSVKRLKCDNRRMMLASQKDCTGCSACFSSCTVGAIAMMPDHEGFLRPVIDETKCVGCGKCSKACPILVHGDGGDPDHGVETYAAWSLDDAARLQGSSGGIFGEIAKSILQQGGVVFGCRIEDGSLKAIHAYAETLEELYPFKRSKYVQSDMRDAFKGCRAFLKTGRRVLFSGTPCQIGGLYAFLGYRPDNLITCDLFCHGVPSPDVFEKFKNEISAKAASPLKSIAFRVKISGEKWPFMEYGFVDSTKNYRESNYPTSFYQAFINDLCLRPSCHHCRFNGGRSDADLTIADFRGLEWERPELCDAKGVSAVIARSDKGKALLSGLNSIVKCPVEYRQISGNSRSYHNTDRKVPRGRAWFFRNFRRMELFRAVALAKDGGYWAARLPVRIVRSLKRIAAAVTGRKRGA